MKLLFLGDICTDSYSSEELGEFYKTNLYNFLKNYDGLIIGNLEAPLLSSVLESNQNKLSLINNTKQLGFHDFCDAYSIANNHIFDQSLEGLKLSIENIEKLGALYFGAGENIESSRKPIILQEGNKKVGLLAYCCFSTNSEFYANFSSQGVAPLIFEYVKEDVDKLKKEVDHIVLLPHWGKENFFYPTVDQVSFARKVIDLGVDAIIGTHPHTIQAYEKYNTGSIYYSLGNFLFNDFDVSKTDKYYQGKFNKEGMVVEVDFSGSAVKTDEYFVKTNASNVPDFIALTELKTPVEKINDEFKENSNTIEHQKYFDDLSITYRFNGRNMQFLNESPDVGRSFRPRFESSKAKIKRVLLTSLRKALYR